MTKFNESTADRKRKAREIALSYASRRNPLQSRTAFERTQPAPTLQRSPQPCADAPLSAFWHVVVSQPRWWIGERPHGELRAVSERAPDTSNAARQLKVRASPSTPPPAPTYRSDRLRPRVRCHCAHTHRGVQHRCCQRPRHCAQGCPCRLRHRARGCVANRTSAAVSSVGCPVGQDQSILIAW